MRLKGGEIVVRVYELKKVIKNHYVWFLLWLTLVFMVCSCFFKVVNASDIQVPYSDILSEDEIQMFNTEFFNGGTDNMNNMLLTSEYEKPEQIDLFQLFYNGISSATEQITTEEIFLLTLLDSQAPYLDIAKITINEMDAFLQENLGITLKTAQKIGIENFYYLERYNSFYVVRGDTNFDWCTITSGKWQSDDILLLEYEKEYDSAKWAVTLRKIENGYQFISNRKCLETESDKNLEIGNDISEYKTGIINTDRVRARSSADVEASPMFALNKGVKVNILGMENDFYKIGIVVNIHEEAVEMIGYVKKEFVCLEK